MSNSEYKILDNLSKGILVINNEFKIIYANQVAEEIFNINKDSILGESLHHLNCQKELCLFCLLSKQIKDFPLHSPIKKITIPNYYQIPDQHLIIKIIRHENIFLVEGKSINFSNDRKKELLTELIQHSKDYMFFKDENLNYVIANQSYLDFVGLKENELIGLNDWDLVRKGILSEELYYQCKCGDNDTLLHGSYSGVEVFLGRSYQVLKQKVNQGVLCVAKDITEIINMTKLSVEDSLTQMYNRRKFNTVYNNIFEDSKYNYYLVLIEFSNLDLINTLYGYQQGDEYLKILSKILLNYSEELFFRLDGSIFCSLTDKNQKNLEKFISHIFSDLDQINITPKITINVGACQIDRTTSKEINYNKASHFLNESKKIGQNQCIIDGELYLKK